MGTRAPAEAMLLLAWTACGPSGPTVDLPDAPALAPAAAGPTIVVTTTDVAFDAGDGAPLRTVDTWATATTAGLLLPGLAEALGPLPHDRLPALAADGAVTFEQVARVLVTAGQAGHAGVDLRTRSGAVPYRFPTWCGGTPTDAAGREKLAAVLAAAPTGPCLAPSVTQVDTGLRVELLQVPQDRPGCTVAVARPREPGSTAWPDSVALPAAGACPSVPPSDAAALGALLDRTAALSQRCGSAWVAMGRTTPWREVLPVYAAVRSRHDAASLGLSGDARPDCERGFVLP